MDIKEAEKLFLSIFERRNNSPHPFSEKHQIQLHNHLIATAEVAKTIAENTPYLNPEKAYIYGLLHDFGRIEDENKTKMHHSLKGYYALVKDYPEIAKISITHSFIDKYMDFDSGILPKEYFEGCRGILDSIQYDDYDRLIQLCDNINIFGKPCTIEERYAEIAERYKVSIEKLTIFIENLNSIKRYFSNMCSRDIYEILGINDESTRF